MIDRIDANMDELRRQVTARRVPLRNGHHESNGRPLRTRADSRFTEFNIFVDLHLANLKQSDAMVWIIIWRHVDKRTGTAILTHARIGEAAGLQRRAVTNVIRRLAESGYIEVVRKGAADRSPSVFKPTLPPPQTGAPRCTPTGAP
ncbi:helix-turn-helix domain-containing protein [Aeoliella sp. ICT_H6.2]|uniref:Helix-turn-helix domain-containing protein n=1 Tax=Aeoliella straminimaris TaxID=2954799 RepID=A0A9X2FFR7_9BACT|nr:helix-turn-helix domain-containing protein [Aeoliella straminimaris]MCO6043321.1 helix-turn-helix domain-containing protein [Aeoliella straminimaris]